MTQSIVLTVRIPAAMESALEERSVDRSQFVRDAIAAQLDGKPRWRVYRTDGRTAVVTASTFRGALKIAFARHGKRIVGVVAL